MNPCIVSFFMNNIDMKTVGLQKSVVEKYNKSKVHHYIIKVDVPHGIAIDYFWTINGHKVSVFNEHDIPKQLDHDLILFMDIDCIPLHESAIDMLIENAAAGKLIGNAQRANHIQNNQHVYAAPSAVAITAENFVKMGKPSAYETNRGDVIEEYTYKAEEHSIPVDFIMPVKYDYPPERYDWEQNPPPYWALADGMPVYGLGTSYGRDNVDLFYHHFQIRFPGQQEKFQRKCEEVLNG